MKKQKLRWAINGLGRIGRTLFRYADRAKLDIALINTHSPVESLPYFLNYDSVHGVWKKNLSANKSHLMWDQKSIPCLSEKNPNNIDWSQYNIDGILECTGRFKKKSDWEQAFSQGVKKVIVSAPAAEADFTLLYGVNQQEYQKDKHHFISNASCTTNCLAPLIFVLKKNFGIKKAFFSTVHSYTADQRLLDSSHKDLRRSRSAGLNIIPTSTGAGQALAVLFPELKDKIKGLAYRVPTANVSLVDLVIEIEKKSTLAQIHQAFEEASKGSLKGILGIEDQPLVSSDFMGRRESAILDRALLDLQDETLLKLSAWYDNESGFSQRIIDFLSQEIM